MATRQSPSARAKDSDRDDTCRILDGALTEGQLSMTEHRSRIGSATSAVTLGDLHALVSDLQTTSSPVQLPALRPRLALSTGNWRFGAAVLVTAVLLGIGIGWTVYGNTSSPLDFTSDPGAKPDGVAPVVLTPPKQLHSLGGLSGLLEQMRKKFGDTKGYRLVIYPEYASLDRPDPGEDRRVLNYYYRGGWDDPRSSAKSDGTTLVDLGAFDAKAVVGILRGAPETLGIKANEVKNTYLIVDPANDPTAPGTLTLSVYVSSDFGSGYIQLAGDGSIKQLNYPS